MKTKKDEEYHHNEMSVSDDFNAILESETAIPVNDIPKAKIVYYDLETTGLDPKTQHDGIGKEYEILMSISICNVTELSTIAIFFCSFSYRNPSMQCSM